MVEEGTGRPVNRWMEIERRIAELLDGGQAPTDVEDVRLAEYRELLGALDRLEYEAGIRCRGA